jgi:hypothetical protein
MNLKVYFEKALFYEDYVNLLNESKSLHLRHFHKFNLTKQVEQKIQKSNALNILTITEPWCGDSLALLPIVKKISLANPNWNLKIILRDQHIELIDKFLTNTKRAIPIFLFLDENFNFLFKWGPRPENASRIFEQYGDKIEKEEIEKSEVILKIRKYYAKDRGEETSKELLNIIFSSIKNN